jgi:hypothetical protein
MTKRRLVSSRWLLAFWRGRVGARLTQGMTTAELWLLGVLSGKLVSNAIQQLDVALLRVLLQGSDEGP